jgi:hypothetical protein
MNMQHLRSQSSAATDSSDEEEEDLPFTFDWEEDFEDSHQRRPENPIHKLLNEAEIVEDDEENFGNKRTRSSDSDSTDQLLTSSGERWEFNKNASFFLRAPVCNTTPPHPKYSSFSPCHIMPVNDSAPLNDKMEKEFVRMDIEHHDDSLSLPSTCISPTNHSTKKTKLNGIENTLNGGAELNASMKKWNQPHI